MLMMVMIWNRCLALLNLASLASHRMHRQPLLTTHRLARATISRPFSLLSTTRVLLPVVFLWQTTLVPTLTH